MNRRGKEEISLEYLVRKAKKGDPQAFIELIEASKQSMYKQRGAISLMKKILPMRYRTRSRPHTARSSA